MMSSSKNGKSFHKFFESWLVKQSEDLDELVRASEEYKNNNDMLLSPLIHSVVKHYEEYYREKSQYAASDVLGMLHPSWLSNLEDAFLWIGGWRPSMAFHLLYSKSGIQLEANLHELIRGFSKEDLGNLSGQQLGLIDELQHKTISEERKLSEKLAIVQESVADTSMVELSHVVSELMREQLVVHEEEEKKIGKNISKKEESLLDLLKKADDLRLSTIKEILRISTPIQSVHFLIAAAELHLRVHEWGKNKDALLSPHKWSCQTINDEGTSVRN
ncbi:protein DELAY OF GERMINATION 1-like [Solanum lycopersicum]|uniref:protein DELAY OF GERMINATION 1-like n=1 Tax=Solanum lycopersicum TaxID=4081 RepID=UPI0002765917|nr:protein DELAY OF GERMINATION 1-like [Solanum lycopersicum]